MSTLLLSPQNNVKSNILEWKVDKCRAVCILLHDFEASPSRFSALGQHLAGNGVSVIAPDILIPSSGGSRSETIKSSEIDNGLEQIHRLILKCKEKFEDTSVFLCGEGYGGILALKFNQNHHELLDGVAVMSPFFKFSINMVKRFDLLMNILLRPQKSYQLPIKTSMVTKNDSYIDSEDSGGRSLNYTAKFFMDYFSLAKTVYNQTNTVKNSLFFMLASDDLISQNNVAHVYYQSLEVEDKRIDYYPEFHSLSIPQDFRSVFNDLSEWILSRTLAI